MEEIEMPVAERTAHSARELARCRGVLLPRMVDTLRAIRLSQETMTTEDLGKVDGALHRLLSVPPPVVASSPAATDPVTAATVADTVTAGGALLPNRKREGQW